MIAKPVVREVSISGNTKSGKATLHATSFVQGATRTIVAHLDANGEHYDHQITSFPGQVIVIQARDKYHRRHAMLSALAHPDVVHMTAWKDDEPAEAFRIDLRKIVETKSLRDSVLDGRGPALHKILGEKAYSEVQEEFAPLLDGNRAFQEFIDAQTTEPNAPCAPGWCLAIFVLPVIGIAGLLIKRCRG